MIAHAGGLVRLFSRSKRRTLGDKRIHRYKLLREYRNTLSSARDELVAIGCVKQYLYTCSYRGRLIFRDLIHDDSEAGTLVHMIAGPVSLVKVFEQTISSRLALAAAGPNNHLKLYCIHPTGRSESELAAHFRFPTKCVEIDNISGATREPNSSQPRATNNNISSSQDPIPRRVLANPACKPLTLHHFWTAPQCDHQHSYHGSFSHCMYCWQASFCMHGAKIVCGTQFGQLIMYDFSSPTKREQLQVSRFPIIIAGRLSHEHLFVYSDGISKVGVVAFETFQEVCTFTDLNLGPATDIKVVRGPQVLPRSEPKFASFYVVASRHDGHIVQYILHPNGDYVLLSDTLIAGPTISVMCLVGRQVYDQLNATHKDSNIPRVQKRKEALAKVAPRRDPEMP